MTRKKTGFDPAEKPSQQILVSEFPFVYFVVKKSLFLGFFVVQFKT
jgi:hypothetical protein